MATHFPNFAEMTDFEDIEIWSTDGGSLGSSGLAWVETSAPVVIGSLLSVVAMIG